MSRKEARRSGLVQLAVGGTITTAAGARALDMTPRQFRRLKARYRAEGVRGLVHRLRGRPSPRALDVELRARVQALIQTTYRDFNDCHCTEKLREVEGLAVGRETVRRLRRALGMPPKRRRRPPPHRTRRPRHPTMGRLVLVDGSPFDWLGTGTPLLLLGAIDDATSTVLALHLRPTEDLHGYLTLLQQLAARHGLPVALYGIGAAVGPAGDLDPPRAEADGVVAGHGARIPATEPVREIARRPAPRGHRLDGWLREGRPLSPPWANRTICGDGRPHRLGPRPAPPAAPTPLATDLFASPTRAEPSASPPRGRTFSLSS